MVITCFSDQIQMNMHNTQGHTMLCVMQTHTETHLYKTFCQYTCVPFATTVAAIKSINLILLMISITHTHLQKYYHIQYLQHESVSSREEQVLSLEYLHLQIPHWLWAATCEVLTWLICHMILINFIWQKCSISWKAGTFSFASPDQRVSAWWEYIQKRIVHKTCQIWGII